MNTTPFPPTFVRMACLFAAAVVFPVSVGAQTPPPVPTVPGPLPTITCPIGAVDIFPGSSIPQIVGLNEGKTTFCLRAGVHTLTGPITPKTGNTFVGEFGAILDGTGWTTGDDTAAAFSAHNEDIDDVTIRNLVIRNMPYNGIYAFKDFADRWTVEYNEIASSRTGIVLSNGAVLRNNYIHHNVGPAPDSSNPAERGGGFIGYFSHNTLVEGNEIAYNGREQKFIESNGVIFRNNFVHHNIGDGIWLDSGVANALVEGNRVEDNGRNGIFYEAGFSAIIHDNAVRRSGDTGVFISMSQNAQVFNHILEDNFRGITYFINCAAFSEGRNFDLQNNSTHDNTITVGSQAGALANGFSASADCTTAQLAPYFGGSKNLKFFRNTYQVPSLGEGRYWIWNGMNLWTQWQSLGHDVDGAAK